MKAVANSYYITREEYALALRKKSRSITDAISRKSSTYSGVRFQYETTEKGKKVWYELASLPEKHQNKVWNLVQTGRIQVESWREQAYEGLGSRSDNVGLYERAEGLGIRSQDDVRGVVVEEGLEQWVQPRHYQEILEAEVLEEEKAQGLARLCGWMHFGLEMTGIQGRLKCNKAFKKWWKQYQPIIAREYKLEELYGKPISNERNWVRRTNEYLEKDWKCLLLNRRGNNNASKNWEWAQTKLLSIYANADPSGESHIKLMIAQVYRKWCTWYAEQVRAIDLKVTQGKTYGKWHSKIHYVNAETGEYIEVGEYQKPAIGLTTVFDFLKRKDIQEKISRLRHGSKYYHDFHRIKTLTKRPNFFGHLWSVDDYDTNFWITNEKGLRTHKRAKAVLVWETQKDEQAVLIGFAVGREMSAGLVWEALLDAIVFTGGLPAEIEADNWNRYKKGRGKKKETDFAKRLKGLFDFGVSFREKANGKLAENHNRILQELFFRHQKGYLGANIQAKSPDSKRNEDHDWYNAAKDTYPLHSVFDIREMLNTCRTEVTGTKEQFQQKIQEKIGDGFTLLSQLSPKRLFPLMKKTEITVRNKALRLEFDKEEYYYDAGVLANNQRYQIFFLPAKTHSKLAIDVPVFRQEVYVMGENNELITLPVLTPVQRAKAEQDDVDKILLQNWYNKKREQDKAIKEFEGKIKEEAFVSALQEEEKQETDDDLKLERVPRFDTRYIDPQAAYGVAQELGLEEKNLTDEDGEGIEEEVEQPESKGIDLGSRFDY